MKWKVREKHTGMVGVYYILSFHLHYSADAENRSSVFVLSKALPEWNKPEHISDTIISTGAAILPGIYCLHIVTRPAIRWLSLNPYLESDLNMALST